MNKSRFEKQMHLITKLAKPIDLRDIHSTTSDVNHIAVTFDDGFKSIIVSALPILAKLNIPATIFIPTGYFDSRAGWIDDKKDPDFHEIVMSKSEICEIGKNALFEFGSHCVSHEKLTNVSNETIVYELTESKRKLEEILKRPINFISFPHGAYNEKVISMARDAGYIRAFGILAPNPLDMDDEFVIGRVKVDPDEWMIEFLLKIFGAYCWLGTIKNLIIHLGKKGKKRGR